MVKEETTWLFDDRRGPLKHVIELRWDHVFVVTLVFSKAYGGLKKKPRDLHNFGALKPSFVLRIAAIVAIASLSPANFCTGSF